MWLPGLQFSHLHTKTQHTPNVLCSEFCQNGRTVYDLLFCSFIVVPDSDAKMSPSHYHTFTYCNSLLLLTIFHRLLHKPLNTLFQCLLHLQTTAGNLRVPACICCDTPEPADSINMCKGARWMLN